MQRVWYCVYLYDNDDDDDTGVEKPALEIDLDPYVNRSGDIWHISFESARNFVRYGYHFGGANRDNSYDECVIFDPYARIVGNSFQNVKRFTEHESSQLSSDLAGTFSGLPKMLQHFKDIGVSARRICIYYKW
ncbi:isoamylase 2 chloroplastic-like [Trifolium pratense]|uniref:Isoamylase 2 chloroplastic-like n=1 Tax=Trifolium pratense TaxID=57577 RepID=A0A2K3PDU7_TRIPR|nr:isoamylase 2 chloroplastic-like [Trifolium pratense]